MTLVQMKHDEDPAKEIFKRLPDLDTIDVLNDRVLVAVYVRPTQTKSGLYVAPATQTEDEYQGKAALILKMGPIVNAPHETRGVRFAVGDWVAVNPSDGWTVHMGAAGNKVIVRLLGEKSIHMRIPAPHVVW